MRCISEWLAHTLSISPDCASSEGICPHAVASVSIPACSIAARTGPVVMAG